MIAVGAGCSSGNSSTGTSGGGGGGGDGAGAGGGGGGGGTTSTPVPTAPARPLALTGLSTGYAVQTPGAAVSVAPVPQMTGGTIVDKDAAIRLGKALFWDMQAGSDGKVACASCHFRAGADNRTSHTTHPGPDLAFGTADDRVGSAGVFSMSFSGISTDLADPVDICSSVTPGDNAQAAIFNTSQRLVTGRQAPPAIGAVFYLDNFWDGRASHDFNGQNPLGGGTAIAGNASLASQSVGPPLSEVEMSCLGRQWNGANSLGAKLVPRTPLAQQVVAADDSVLGPFSNFPNKGLKCGFSDRLCTYADLIAAAFGMNGLSGQAAIDSYIANFSAIWGQAVQAYEATLIPDRTPYDLGTLSATQLTGLNRFRQKCETCHREPEFSDATVRAITANGGTSVAQQVTSANALVAPGTSDQGYHNIGASPTAEDHGRKGSPGGTYHTAAAGAVDFNDGAFKTPGLRNVKLTAPYMHNGRLATINDVINFYQAGTGQTVNDETDSQAVGASAGGDAAAVADFLENGLTDCRVEHERAPFDHPELSLPNGPNLPARGATGDGTPCL